MDSTLLTIGLIISLGVSATGLFIAIRKAPFDIRKLLLDNKKMEVELSDKYEEQLNRMSSYNLDLRNQIQELRTKLDTTTMRHTAELAEMKTRYENEMSEIRASLLKTEQRAQLVEDWAARLCNQVESLGEVPVPFQPLKRNTRPVTK
jgi:DNA anti-recombination protein RmuC